METVDKKVVTTTNHRWFEFSQEEASVLREALLDQVDWEIPEHGKYYDFFLGLYNALADVSYGQPS